MLRLLVEKELREQIGSPKFALSFGICAVLILMAFVMGARNYTSSLEQYQAAITENTRQMDGSTSWTGVNHTIYSEPQPLSALVSGISNDMGRSIRMSTTGELKPTNSRFNEEPILAVFRFMDLEFLFSVALSLFAVLFAYDAVNGEKERGTLRLALSNPVSRSTYIIGKMIGTFLSLFVPLLIPVLIGILLLPLLGVNLDSDELVRLVLILGIGFLFFAAFMILSVLVSSSTRHSSSSFLIMLVIWICCVLIIPRTAVLMSARIVDVPSVDSIEKQKREYASQLLTEDRAKMSTFRPDLGLQPNEIMAAFSAFTGKLSTERDSLITEFNARLNEDRENRQREQEIMAINLARLSPATSMSLAMTTMAGTSIAMKNQFSDQAKLYQSTYRTFLESKRQAGSFSMGGGIEIRVSTSSSAEPPKTIDPSELPVFSYEDVTMSSVLPIAFVDMGMLFGFNILFFVGAFVLFLRFDVR
jgi:ABC-type transport system involved in multi-copper enzyme maturation permease subunit